MSTDATDLLRLLGSRVTGVGGASKAGASPSASSSGLESADFAELLQKAQSGELTSGVPVSVAKDAGVTLSDTDLAMLTLAADKAETAGIRRAMVLTGDQALIMDVQTRTIVGKADMKNGVLSGIDGVIRVGASGGADVEKTLPPPTGFIGSNPSLAALLAGSGAAKK